MGTDQLPQCVLLVEDHEPTRYGMRHMLTRAGVGRIVEAGTRDEAVAALGDDALPIDCVLLDWLIPGGGADVLLSTRERRPGVGVIVLTVAYERERAAIVAMKPDAVFSKPIDVEGVLDALRACLRQSGAGAARGAG